MSKVIGIDLGTTNSCVAVMEATGPRILESKTGQPTTPSVVAATDGGRRLIGHLAKRQAITNPANTVSGAKRLIGRRWGAPDVEKAITLVSYRCVPGPHGDIRIEFGGKVYAVPEVSSMVLQEMRVIAERALGETISQAVITVPAYFNDNQRQATKDAGRIAGLDVLRIINEPTAAALAYGYGRRLEQKIIVYDLGGGTFDISILELGQDVYEVLATAGDTFLGGDDFDERVIQWLVDQCRDEHDVDLRQDKMALQRMRDAAEKAKVELSSAMEAEISLPFIMTTKDGTAVHLHRKLTRDTLNGLVRDLVDKTITICSDAVKRSGAKATEIGAVILVGGMTRMPLVQEKVEQCFGIAPSKGVHPDEAVAAGAAIQGHLLSLGAPKTPLLLDVTSHDLGIMVAGGLFDVLIPKETTIPTSARKTFTTVRDGQTQVRILVLQGQSSRAEQNELLGEFLLDGLRSAPPGQVKVEVNFEISADGIVGVSARDLDTGREQNITVSAQSGLTENEIREMITENQENQMQAVANEAFESDRLTIERLLRDIDKMMAKLQPMTASKQIASELLSRVQDTIATARDAVARRDAQGVANQREPLERTLTFLKNLAEPPKK